LVDGVDEGTGVALAGGPEAAEGPVEAADPMALLASDGSSSAHEVATH